MGLSAGTGSAFSLLPAQNATGNWIKVVQRVPVRISLDAKELQQNPLRVGLSMTVKVDIAEKGSGKAMNCRSRTKYCIAGNGKCGLESRRCFSR